MPKGMVTVVLDTDEFYLVRLVDGTIERIDK